MHSTATCTCNKDIVIILLGLPELVSIRLLLVFTGVIGAQGNRDEIRNRKPTLFAGGAVEPARSASPELSNAAGTCSADASSTLGMTSILSTGLSAASPVGCASAATGPVSAGGVAAAAAALASSFFFCFWSQMRIVLRRDLLGVHESASSGEWSHDGQVVGNTSLLWPGNDALAQARVLSGHRRSLHGVQMALLQHSSLYASRASALQRAQKKALGKTVVGRELDT
jgi:hypothetical protein